MSGQGQVRSVTTENTISNLEATVDVTVVAAWVRSHPAVEDCAVRLHPSETSPPEWIVYGVPVGRVLSDPWRADLERMFPAAWGKMTFVPVSAIPLTATGEVDWQALSQLPILDSELLQRWEQRVRSLPEIERVAAIVVPSIPQSLPLHLRDLLPDPPPATAPPIQQTTPTEPTNLDIAQKQIEKPQAIAEGKPLKLSEDFPATLPELLQRTAATFPQNGIRSIEFDGPETFQSYSDLLDEAMRILAGLRKLGLQPQDKVIFQLSRRRDFIAAFWGCALGGFVPVPIATAPTYDGSNRTVEKLLYAWQLCDRPLILTDEEIARSIRGLAKVWEVESLRVATLETLRSHPPARDWHCDRPNRLALLMLTSGSTGNPKGVMLSDRNLIARTIGSIQMNGFNSRDITLNWMPLDHVAGLIYFHIRDVFLGCNQIQLAAETILQDPLKWLDYLDCFRVSITFAPNFAFSLVNDRVASIPDKRWDLSSLRFVLNGAEQISAKTTRRFLQILAPHQLSETAIYPAWGMSETSSGVTYSHTFRLSSTTDSDPFVEVGSPIPGCSLRIVDDRDRPVAEETIGHLQVKGDTITTGYYKNPELNRQVFTADGWFNTGDLGYIHQGRLTLTGREKDLIIINGVNYYRLEIEAKIEEIPGVEISFAAACAVRAKDKSDDKLAIFFHPSEPDESRLSELIEAIRGQVVRTIGILPDYIVPVQREEIPKTEIGKIQRSQLKARFDRGEFAEAIKRIDILTGNNNTLPDWFYTKIWRRKALAIALSKSAGSASYGKHSRTIVFTDRLGLAEALIGEFPEDRWVLVERGEKFVKHSQTHFGIEPHRAEDYQFLFQAIAEDNIAIETILYLWNYDESHGEITSAEELEESYQQKLYPLLFLIQALSPSIVSANPIRFYVISQKTQAVTPSDRIDCKKAPILALLKTISLEFPGISCHHLDLPGDRVETDAALILQELQGGSQDREVAYRDAQRWVPRLKKVKFSGYPKRSLCFKPNGIYLLSGGLGGIGVEIARYLLENYSARVAIVGRTILPNFEELADAKTAEFNLEHSEQKLEKIAAYQALEALAKTKASEGADLMYAAADICDREQLQGAIDQIAQRWQGELDGIIQLAGMYRERLVSEEHPEELKMTLHPQILGIWMLHQLLQDKPDSLFVTFASVSGVLGGAMVGGYAAANSFLEAFSQYQRQCGIQSYFIAWTQWDNLGMSRNYRFGELLQRKGYQVLSPRQGIASLQVCLQWNLPEVWIGLNGDNPVLHSYLEAEVRPLQTLQIYYTLKSGTKATNLVGLKERDRFGSETSCEFRQVEEIPVNAEGDIDRQRLVSSQVAAPNFRRTTTVAPQNEIERAIATVWQEVLQRDRVNVTDNFFDLGGHSLLVARIQHQLETKLDRSISMVELFTYSTIKSLADYLLNRGTKAKLESAQSSDSVPDSLASRAQSRKNSTRRQRQTRQQHREN